MWQTNFGLAFDLQQELELLLATKDREDEERTAPLGHAKGSLHSRTNLVSFLKPSNS